MKGVRIYWAVAAVATLYGCGGALDPVRLEPEVRATLHVGELASVDLPSGHDWNGSAGSSLMLISQKQQQEATVYLYRAVAPGDQTLLETPREPTPDGCISCVTVHYFVTVVQ